MRARGRFRSIPSVYRNKRVRHTGMVPVYRIPVKGKIMGKQDPTSREAVRERLRQAFERWGGSQSELAAKIGAAKGTVSDWFNPKKEPEAIVPDGERMAKLPSVLGVSGHWLLTGEGPSVPGGEGALKRAQQAGAGTVLAEMARIIEQLRLVHASESAGGEMSSRRAAQVIEHERAQSRSAASMPGRRQAPRRRAG